MALAALLMRAAGMGMRVWLSGKLGAEGMGVYQLTLSAYAFFALISASGVTVTVTRLVSSMIARNDPAGAAYAAERVMAAAFIISSVGGICMFFCADMIGGLLGSVHTVPALRILSPSLPLMAVSAAARGYFTARRKVLAPTIEQMIEQATEIAVCAAAFALFPTHDLDRACLYAAAGTTAAEGVSFVYTLIVYYADANRLTRERSRVSGLLGQALPIYLPCTASSAMRSSLAAIENMLIPAGLMKGGADKSTALSRYGMISGMALPVIVFPSFLVLPCATLIITEMSSAKARDDEASVRRMTEKALGLTLRYAIPVSVLMVFFSRGLSVTLYGTEDIAVYIAGLAPVVPLMYLDSAADGILKGLGEQTSYMIFNAVDSALRVALMFLLVPVMGAAGVIAVIIFSELFNTALSLMRLLKVSSARARVGANMLLPTLCAVLPCLLYRLAVGHIGADPGCIVGIGICGGAYCLLMLLCSPEKVKRAATKCGSFRRLFK